MRMFDSLWSCTSLPAFYNTSMTSSFTTLASIGTPWEIALHLLLVECHLTMFV